MALVADLYGMDVREAMSLSERETAFMLDKARTTFFSLAATSPDMQSIMRNRLAPTLRSVRAARKAGDGGDDGGNDGGLGDPPNV